MRMISSFWKISKSGATAARAHSLTFYAPSRDSIAIPASLMRGNPPTLRSRVYGVWEITFPSCFPSFSVLVVLSFQDLVLLFSCFQGGSGRGVGTPDILVDPLVDESSTSRGRVVDKSSASRRAPPCRQRLRSRLEAKQRLCSGLDATTSILGLPRYPLSALWHPFFVAFGNVFGNFWGRWFRDPIFASIWGSQSGPKSLLFGGAEVPEV